MLSHRDPVAPGELLTVPQVLRIVPIGRSTLYALIDSAELPHYRISAAGGCRGRILIRRADLEAFIEKTRVSRPRAPVRVDVDGLLAKVRRSG